MMQQKYKWSQAWKQKPWERYTMVHYLKIKAQEIRCSVPCLAGTLSKLQSGTYGPLTTCLRSLDKNHKISWSVQEAGVTMEDGIQLSLIL